MIVAALSPDFLNIDMTYPPAWEIFYSGFISSYATAVPVCALTVHTPGLVKSPILKSLAVRPRGGWWRILAIRLEISDAGPEYQRKSPSTQGSRERAFFQQRLTNGQKT
jgi:hypothetical protein